MTPAADPRAEPQWGFEDLALFIGAVFPCLAIASLLARQFHFPSDGVRTMAFQSIFYALLLVAMYLLVSWRYRQPFWRALGFKFPFRGLWLCLVAGPVFALSFAALGAALRAPEEPAIQNLLTDKLSRIVVMTFACLVGPIFEEIVFRGFLFPVFERSLGGLAAVFLTAAPFALLHGSQYHWSWQSVFIVALAGVAFGFARYLTGSTTASTLLHIGYNTTLFAAVLVMQRFATSAH